MEDRLERILSVCRRHVPGLRLVHKAEVPWMRAASVLLTPFTPDFSTRYTTVLGSTVYLPQPPDLMPPRILAATLAHELVHQLDARRWGPLFYLSYAGALPAGRTARAHWERRAYAVDLMLAYERGGVGTLEHTAEEIADLFASSAYLWMWAGRGSARRYLAPVVEAVRRGELQQTEPYAEILQAWRG